MITKLQLGTSRLENIEPKGLVTFLDSTWVHLGDPKVENNQRSSTIFFFSNTIELFKSHSISYIIKRILTKLQKISSIKASAKENPELYKKTNFLEFFYRKGDRLPFDDCSINFIYSEHFFEHLFLDEAVALLKECYRILRPFGVIRSVVPDADLRSYAAPEPIGFPDKKLKFDNPAKHKTRWSVYSFSEVLTIAGFKPIPVRYCDKLGNYIKTNITDIVCSYSSCLEEDLILNLDYVMRIDSLIVDGIKNNLLS